MHAHIDTTYIRVGLVISVYMFHIFSDMLWVVAFYTYVKYNYSKAVMDYSNVAMYDDPK